ncbi:hypothetical protein AB205_0025470 [Aquarana catesbeiana]|uniref:Uncharacterized protein n=1 Tax=Aquarana catesbeiana TaxID=8400 RepID=A0A2G9RF16_AQUCT|nr:hypothetical protein AB205_0025470 [Aquarana catesbeiana]
MDRSPLPKSQIGSFCLSFQTFFVTESLLTFQTMWPDFQ